jgi:hypothetical protein
MHLAQLLQIRLNPLLAIAAGRGPEHYKSLANCHISCCHMALSLPCLVLASPLHLPWAFALCALEWPLGFCPLRLSPSLVATIC